MPAFALGLALLNGPILDIKAVSGIIVDADSGDVLWEREPHRRMFPASTTKIMTALLVVEGMTPEERIAAPSDVRRVKESSLNLYPGEVLTADGLLKGILLRSGNDAAYTAAVHLAGNKKDFAQIMNDRAVELGCEDTHFTNANGLHDANHYTSAWDLAVMARVAMQYEWFSEVVGLRSCTIQRSKNTKDVSLNNHNRWLDIDGRALGVKTGWTTPAGHCFVGCASLNGRTIITVQLKSDRSWVEDQVRMVDWAFAYGYE